MPIFTETKTLKSLKLVPELDIIITEHEIATLKDGVVITKSTEGRSYSNNQIADFEMEVAPTGASLADIVDSFNAAAVEQRDQAVAAKATAEAALTAAQAQVATLQAQIDAYTPPVPVVPSFITVSPRQIRQALTQAGLRTAVEMAVSQGSQALKDWYEFAGAFEENNANVTAMAAALGVSDESLHDLFELAASL